ncbi:MAG: alpha/beta fold hydrolase [Bacteriovoracaceae bacterium]|nr:alpha/beta fold hydrolase [Bacteriovoracaceae bacterium]
MNPFTQYFDKFANNCFFESSDQKVTYAQVKEKYLELSENINFPKDTLIVIQETNPLSVLIQVMALWEKNCTPVLISPDTPADLMSLYETQVPFGETCPEGNIVFFTSGSNSTPKGVVHSFETLFNSALATTEHYQLKESEKWGLTLPVHHTGGFMILMRTLICGASVFYEDSWRSVINHPCDFYSLVPTQLIESIENTNLEKSKVVLIGGAPMAKELLEKANTKNIPLYLSYGMTETAAQITSSNKNPTLPNFAGNPLIGTEVAIDNSNKIKIKSNALMVGFFQHGIFQLPEFEDGWFVQNDLGEITQDGLVVNGRTDKVFISGGENIDPTLIEKALLEIDSVKNAFVKPVEDEKFSKVPIAFVECHPNEIPTIWDELNFRLPKYMIPKDIIHFKWDYQSSLKPESRSLEFLLKLHLLKSSSPFNFKFGGTLGKKVCLFLHGFMGNLLDWEDVLNELDQDIFWISLDLPGHGETLSNKFSDQNDILNELSTFITSLECPFLTGVGYSMGGRILLQLAIQSPTLFNKLVLESVHLGLENSTDKQSRIESDKNLFNNVSTREEFSDFLDNWYALPLFEGIKNHTQYEDMKESKLDMNISELKAALNLMSTGHQDSAQNFLKGCSLNIQFVAGEKDQKYIEFLTVINNLKNEKVTTQSVPNCSHNTHLQNPQFLIDLIKK